MAQSPTSSLLHQIRLHLVKLSKKVTATFVSSTLYRIHRETLAAVAEVISFSSVTHSTQVNNISLATPSYLQMYSENSYGMAHCLNTSAQQQIIITTNPPVASPEHVAGCAWHVLQPVLFSMPVPLHRMQKMVIFSVSKVHSGHRSRVA